MVEIKFCKKHGLTEFGAKNAKRLRCKKCSVEAVSKRRKELKQKAIVLKGGSCQKCGYNKCVDALQFHHRNPSEKEFSISANRHVISWEKLKIELEKCDLLCANCHAEEHFKLGN